jgi:hypothetical protein
VQQDSQLLSFTGTTLNLAATLLTVSVLPGNFESESSGAVASVGSVGLGQPVGQPKDNGGQRGSGEEPGGAAESSAPGPPAAAAALPRWEWLSIGLQEAWEQARAAIRELESPSPLARDQNSSAGPAVGQPPRPAAAVPARPSTRAGTETEAHPAASADRIAPALQASEREQSGRSRVIDAALEVLGAEQGGGEPSARESSRFWDGLARAEHPGTTRALVAAVATAIAAGTAWAGRSHWRRRRSVAAVASTGVG